MRHPATIASLLALSVCLVGCSNQNETTAPVAAAAETSEPGLAVGQKAPGAMVTTMDGAPKDIASYYPSGPTVIVFYRGGWCPYCNKHLAAWSNHMDELKSLGATLIAISPESPDNALDTIEKDKIPFTVLSDTQLQAARAFSLNFTVDPATQTRYKGFGVDLEKWNTSKTWDLPAPGTFVIDKSGVIRFAAADWDYKKRTDPAEVIAAIKAMR